MSQATSDIVKEEAIILLDYRPLQIIWKGMCFDSQARNHLKELIIW